MPGRRDDGDARRGSRWRVAAWTSAAAVLLLPLAAMQVTDVVAWSPADFALAGALVLGAGAACEGLARMGGSRAYRAAAGVALAAAVLLVWGNGALGLIGSEENPANLMVLAVLAVGVAGAFVARGRPDGMAGALLATALAQALVAVTAVATGLGAMNLDVLMLTGLFAGLWLASAWLFSAAARAQAPGGAA